MWGRHVWTQKQSRWEEATFDVPQLHTGGGFALLLLLPSPGGVLCASPLTLLQPGEERKVLRNCLFKKQMFLPAS